MLLTLYIGCAIFGGTIMVLQFLLTGLGFGLGDDVDGGFDVDDADTGPEISHEGGIGIFRMLSFRTATSGLAFFGLAGMSGYFAAEQFGIGQYKEGISILAACLFGLSSVYLVYHLYRWMYSLRFDGSVTEATLLGANGTVYVRIPEHGASGGKILINQQERTMEYEAITPGEELKSGTPITISRVISPSLVEVVKV